jgi:hypothetical protein
MVRIERIPVSELRRKFNEGQYYERLRAGELSELVLEEGHPSPPRAQEPFCTRSQLVAYYEGGTKVAEVHQVVRPDGDLGASGRPDPKRLLAGEILYVIDI